MSYILLALITLLLTVILFPAILFLRARRSPAWDNSNIFNMYRVIYHLALHPEDFGKMFYENGDRPFHYINKDEYSEVVNSRPK